MHEYSVAHALREQVLGLARERNASAVRAVFLRIGDLAGIEPELLDTAWSHCREGTLCAGAPLRVQRVATRWECARCGTALARDAILRCRECGTPGRLAAGDEIVLDRVVMEVP